MAKGVHSFYVFPCLHNQVNNRENYFIGRFIGDHFNDESFAVKIQKIQQKLNDKFGSNYTAFWSPALIKPYRPLTIEQKYQRAVTKASNIHKKNVINMLQENTLFADDFLYEEIIRHQSRIEILKQRYHQP